LATTNECTSIVGHSDGHAEALMLKVYMWHCLMQHVQGYTRSHWMPLLVNYLLRIAPATAMVTAKKKDVTCTHFDGRFDGHRDAAAAVLLYRAHRPMEEVHGFIKSKPLNAAIG
jgi:hypothetical protein